MISGNAIVYADCGPLGEDVEFEVFYNYSYTKGRVSGPPEDCYPPDSDLEIIGMRCKIGGVVINCNDMDHSWCVDEVEQHAHETWCDRKSGYDGE